MNENDKDLENQNIPFQNNKEELNNQNKIVSVDNSSSPETILENKELENNSDNNSEISNEENIFTTIKIDESSLTKQENFYSENVLNKNTTENDDKKIESREDIFNKENLLLKILKNKWFYVVIALVLSLLFFGYVLSGIIFSESKKENIETKNQTNQNQQNTNTDTVFYKKIDGTKTSSKEESNGWPFAVIIENSIDARPLSGVTDANIVYEALAEGSITRFLCIYDGKSNVSKIGPVRSARPYYLDIANEYDSLFVHFGGSPEALDRLDKGYYNVIPLNGIIYDGTYFWRDNSRQAPHNAYISTDSINAFKEKIGKQNFEGTYSSWLFNDKNINEIIDPKNINIANNIFIKYSDQTSSYDVIWKYDKNKSIYNRFTSNDQKEKDSSLNEITTKNIIIQFTSTSVVDEKLRKEINLTEGGKAIMIRDGYSIEGYWKKNNYTNRTKFYYKLNNTEKEFEFNPGKTWVNIVPKDYKIKID